MAASDCIHNHNPTAQKKLQKATPYMPDKECIFVSVSRPFAAAVILHPRYSHNLRHLPVGQADHRSSPPHLLHQEPPCLVRFLSLHLRPEMAAQKIKKSQNLSKENRVLNQNACTARLLRMSRSGFSVVIFRGCDVRHVPFVSLSRK